MLLRNTMWGLLGEGLPMAAALISIPVLIQGVGMERFGALTFVWALLGLLAVLDLGLTRTLVQIIAERRGAGASRIAAIAGPALLLTAGLGIIGGGVVALAADPIAARFIQASGEVSSEARQSLLLAALIVPVALISSGLRGVLEAHQRFRAVNIVRMTVGVANYLSPAAVMPFSDSLVPVLAAIAVGRVIGMTAFGLLAARQVPDLLRPSCYGGESLRPLFSMSAWMMLNNFLGPVMAYADRFILAGLLPAAVIAYYTTPFEIASRLLFIPTALSGVLFPMAAGVFRRDPAAVGRMLEAAGFAVLAVFSLAVFGAVALGEPLLHLWLGADFAARSAPVLSVLMLGILLNAVAYTPYALIHGIGRVDVTARLQLLELPLYFAGLWGLAHVYGLTGAAVAWGLRTGVDLLLLLSAVRRLEPQAGRAAIRIGGATCAAAIPAAAGLLIGDPGGVALALAATGVVAVFSGNRLWRLRKENGGIAAAGVCCYVASTPSKRG